MELIHYLTEHFLTRAQLLARCSLDLLDAASSSFAPHEVARSSRHRYVDEMRRLHGL